MRVDQPTRRLLLASVLTAFAAPWALATLRLPMALILPTLSMFLVFSGFALAAASYLSGLRANDGHTDRYTVAGLLVFLGFSIALLTDAKQTLTLFEEMEAQALSDLWK